MTRKHMEIHKSDSILLNAGMCYGKGAVDANHPFTSMKLYDDLYYLSICLKTTFITLFSIDSAIDWESFKKKNHNPVSIILSLWICKSIKFYSPPGTDSKISLALNLWFTLNSSVISSGDLSVSLTCDVVTAIWRLSTRDENIQNYKHPLTSSLMHKSMT